MQNTPPSNENRHLDEFGMDPKWRYISDTIDNTVSSLLEKGMHRSEIFMALEFAMFGLLQASNPTKGIFLDDCTDVSAILSDLKKLWGLQETITNMTANWELALERAQQQLEFKLVAKRLETTNTE